jgi:hypothetical protein
MYLISAIHQHYEWDGPIQSHKTVLLNTDLNVWLSAKKTGDKDTCPF